MSRIYRLKLTLLNKKDTKIIRHMITHVVVLLIMIFGIIHLSRRENYARQLQQINEYINELSGRTAQHISDILENRLSSITSIAYLYGESMTSEEVDSEHLKALEENSGFDRIRFVNSKGESFTSDGTFADVADRDYFINGMHGLSGNTYVLKSRFNDEHLIGVYAPVYYQNKICGVMVGFVEEATVSNTLQTQLYGHPVYTVIINKDGIVLGQYTADKTNRLKSFNQITGYIEKKDLNTVENAIRSCKKASFSYQGSVGKSSGYIVPIDKTDWCMVQLFSSQSTKGMVDEVNRDELFVILLFSLAIIWFVFNLIYIIKEKIRFDHEKVADCLKKINISGNYLLKLINNVLDMARIESGKIEMNIQAHHIPSKMKNIEYIFLADINKKI